MLFVYGTALLVTAVLLLGIARHAVTRLEGSSWVRDFATTEIMALLITCLCAFGTAFVLGGAVSGQGVTGLGLSLGIVALAIVGVVRVFRSKPAGQPVTPKPGGRATT